MSAAASVAATVGNNAIYGLSPAQLFHGNATVAGTKQLASRPVLDSTSAWQPAGALVQAASMRVSVASPFVETASMAFMAQPAQPALSTLAAPPPATDAPFSTTMGDAMKDIVSSAMTGPETGRIAEMTADHSDARYAINPVNIAQMSTHATDHDGRSGGDWHYT